VVAPVPGHGWVTDSRNQVDLGGHRTTQSQGLGTVQIQTRSRSDSVRVAARHRLKLSQRLELRMVAYCARMTAVVAGSQWVIDGWA
jgi:hypothetical protein